MGSKRFWILFVPVNVDFSRRFGGPVERSTPSFEDPRREEGMLGSDEVDGGQEAVALDRALELGPQPNIARVVASVFVIEILFEKR